MLEIARETYYLYRRNFITWVKMPALVIPSIFISIFLFLVFGASFDGVVSLPGFPIDDYNAFVTGMIIVQAVVFSGSDAGFALVTDIASGFFDKQLLAPINRMSILFGQLLMAGTRALLQTVVIILVAIALGVEFKTGVPGIIAIIIVSAGFGITWSCLGIIIALQSKSAQATQASFILFFPLIFLTDAFMPKEFLSGWFKVAVTINPVTYVLEGIRAMVISGWDWTPVSHGLWALLGLTVPLVALATWLYRRSTA